MVCTIEYPSIRLPPAKVAALKLKLTDACQFRQVVFTAVGWLIEAGQGNAVQ
jgi:hypothetical protein